MPRYKSAAASPSSLTDSQEKENPTLLSYEEEKELSALIAAGDSYARERMISANLGLVGHIARAYLGLGLSFEDLVGEGNLGLLEAVNRFDGNAGTRFSTYASYWIKETIRKALTETTKPIRLPTWMAKLLSKWDKMQVALTNSLGREPTVAEIGAALGLKPKKLALVRNALLVRSQNSALASGLATKDEEDNRTENIPDENTVLPDDEEVALEYNLREAVFQRLDAMDVKKATIIRWTFGLDAEDDRTQTKVREELGLSLSEWNKLKKEALAELRMQTENETDASAASKQNEQSHAPALNQEHQDKLRERLLEQLSDMRSSRSAIAKWLLGLNSEDKRNAIQVRQDLGLTRYRFYELKRRVLADLREGATDRRIAELVEQVEDTDLRIGVLDRLADLDLAKSVIVSWRFGLQPNDKRSRPQVQKDLKLGRATWDRLEREAIAELLGQKTKKARNRATKTIWHKRGKHYHDLAKQHGLEWCGKKAPTNAKTKTEWRCANGHIWSSAYHRIQQGKGCKQCHRTPPNAYEKMARGAGLKWIGPEVTDTNTKTGWQCPKGHQWQASFSRIRQGGNCPQCRRKQPQDYHDLAQKKGLTWHGPPVANVKTDTNWECAQGHRWAETYHRIEQLKRGCPHC